MTDKPFEATDKDWRQIENRADIPQGDLSRALVELRDRVAALEAERVAMCKPALQVAAVPSDRELWELRFHALLNADPKLVATTWDAAHSLVFGHAPIKANRALYDHGYEHGLAAGRAEHGTTPEPEPNHAPAGDGGLVEVVLDAMGEGTEVGPVEARAAIFAVAKWLRSQGVYAIAAGLELEAQR
jgi:hypothetical protein